MPASRKYDEETRARAVRMVLDRQAEPGTSKVAARRQVGALLDINPSTLRNWVEREEVDTGQRPGVPTETAQRIKQLERENAELCRANEILKLASAFFARELDPKSPRS